MRYMVRRNKRRQRNQERQERADQAASGAIPVSQAQSDAEVPLSVLTDPDFDMSEVWRDWLTEQFVEMASEMSSKEIDIIQAEYF